MRGKKSLSIITITGNKTPKNNINLVYWSEQFDFEGSQLRPSIPERNLKLTKSLSWLTVFNFPFIHESLNQYSGAK